MREDLINSAVSFLRDPQVASSPLAKKLEFLESKKMTSEEIDEALRRAQDPAAEPAAPATASASVAAPQPSRIPSTATIGPPVGAYPSLRYMPPPPVPKRDWKDYFVMATVSVGVAYALYEVGKRYVLPMIVPPTPASLEADKQALEHEFARTEALVEQLQRDTEELKQKEEERSAEFNEVMASARETVESARKHAEERQTEFAALKRNLDSLKDSVPRSLDAYRVTQDQGLKEILADVKSLKQLVSNRVRTGSPGVPPASSVPNSVPIPAPSGSQGLQGPQGSAGNPASAVPSAPSAPAASAPKDDFIPVPGGAVSRTTTGPPAPKGAAPAGIPAWQLASGT